MRLPVRSPLRRRRLWNVVLLVLLGVTRAALGQTLLPPDPARTLGKVVAFDGFVDENGRGFSPQGAVSAPNHDGQPWIVSPMYTRCPHTCSAVTVGLKRALDQSGLDASEYRVVSFSFDPQESGERLRSFRSRLRLPERWLTLRAESREALERTLRGLDFRTITVADGEFEHPNLVAVLTPDMRLVSYVFGINFSPAEIAAAVRRARAGGSPLDPWRIYLFLFAAFGFLVSALVFVALFNRRRAKAKRGAEVPMVHGV
jgi:cytochrome oxidase Cu insertion factor (SCO1/SenC/PrrC family)